jgi:hypothetical protein
MFSHLNVFTNFKRFHRPLEQTARYDVTAGQVRGPLSTKFFVTLELKCLLSLKCLLCRSCGAEPQLFMFSFKKLALCKVTMTRCDIAFLTMSAHIIGLNV